MASGLTPARLAEIRDITEEAGAVAERRGDNGILLDATRDLLAEVERLRAASDEQARELQSEVGRLRTVLRAVLEGCRCGLGGLQGDALRAAEALQGPPLPRLRQLIDEAREQRAVNAILGEGRQ